MKQLVRLSTYSLTVSAIITAVMAGLLIYYICEGWTLPACIIGICCGIMCISALFYMPVYISVDDTHLRVHRPLRSTLIPLAGILSAELCQPTMASRRICGSGGWLGYWGLHSERDLGRYFAYYGKASDCFLVRLRDGRQYMLGCRNPRQTVDYIRQKISQ